MVIPEILFHSILFTHVLYRFVMCVWIAVGHAILTLFFILHNCSQVFIASEARTYIDLILLPCFLYGFVIIC